MHLTFIAIVLAAMLQGGAAPGASTDTRTEAILLRYVSAADLERMLVGSEVPGKPVVPLPGVLALTTDARRNALVVVGSEAGIQEVQRLARIVDVPASSVRLSVWVLRPDDVFFQRIKPRFEVLRSAPPAEPGARKTEQIVASLDPQQAAEIAALPATGHFETGVANNRPLRVRWSWTDAAPETLAVLIPRVNGDGTVTFYLSPTGTKSIATGKPSADPTIELRGPMWTGPFAIRRIARGQALVVAQDGGPALVVRLLEVVPAAADPPVTR
jgi:hypothetical protein